MSDFNISINYVLGNEGGLTNNPEDHGGITNFGITKPDIAEFLKRDLALIEDSDISTLTRDKAEDVYKALYWDKIGLSDVTDRDKATILLDASVNMGMGTVARMVQSLYSLEKDSTWGPKTRAAVNSAYSTNFIKDIVKEIQVHYVKIVVNNPTQIVFLLGWINRSHRYLEFL